MSKKQVIVLFGFFPAIVIAGAVMLIGSAAKPSRFTARAAFAVDWNSMPSVPNDEKASKVRSEWRNQIIREVIRLPNSDVAITEVLQSANALSDDQNKNSAINSALKSGLRITLLKKTAECDQFSIEVQNNDSNFAQAAAHGILQGTISKIKAEAKAAGGLAALRSYANVEDVIRRKDELRAERRRLQDADSPLSPQDARQRLQEIEAELFALELDHANAGLGLLSNLFDVFSTDAIKVIEEVHVEKRGAGYGFSIPFAAAILGCTAGIAGLVTRRFVQAKSATNRTAPNVPPVISTPPSIPRQSPFVRQIQCPTPPVIPPPIPVQARR